MKWIFDPYPPSLVEQDVTQSDQFRNDDVDLPDSLGREAIQNSLDAAIANNGPVRLRFALLRGPNAPSSAFMNRIFEGNLNHAEAAKIDLASIDFDQPSALIIEDFGTKGLTGSTDTKDDDNFCDFWRRHGRSHKSGKNLGRWGLGKLVFSMTSQLKAFFGYTVQACTNKSALMGQAVLGMHRLDDTVFPAHGFFGDRRDASIVHDMPVPVRDQAIVDEFIRQFRLKRIDEPGLSIVIPFPDPTITPESMVDVVILNYFIPILRRQLTLQIDDLTIDHSNVLEHALSRKLSQLRDIPQVFNFVREATACTSFFRPNNDDWHTDGKLAESEFNPEDLDAMRRTFAAGGLVATELPIVIHRTGVEPQKTYFQVFVQRPSGIVRGQDYYVRGGITLPQETKFRDRKALGMLIAEDTAIATFLGDAENASHTKWNGKAEKLQRYRHAERTLKAIRNSIVALHDHLAQAIEEENERALIEYFWTPGANPAPKKRQKPDDMGPVNPPPPPPLEAPIRIADFTGGITITPTARISEMALPLEFTIQFAYDVPRGNPFKLFSEEDFDLADEDTMQIELDGGIEADVDRNALNCKITNRIFNLRIFGFDPNRDLITRALIEGV